MIITIIAYLLILFVVPTLSALASYVVIPLQLLLKKILIPDFISMAIFGIAYGFISIWLGVNILSLFNKEVRALLTIILLSVAIYHYNKGKDMSMLVGDILGIIIGWNVFVN